MKNFSIILMQERPDQPYYSGSKVTGSLLVEVDESKSYDYISVTFEGKANVHWTESTMTGSDSTIGSSQSTQTHHYRSSETYVSVPITVWTKEGAFDGQFGPGAFTFPFEFTIPSDVPSSFESTVGRIQYEVKGRIGTGHLKFDHRTEVRIPVQQLVPVAAPELQQSVRREVQKRVGCLCCASGPIVMTVELPKTGYCIGETVPLRVSIENGSSRQIQLFVHLMKNVEYIAEGSTNWSVTAITNASCSDQIVTQDWTPNITVPPTDVINEESCHIIKV